MKLIRITWKYLQHFFTARNTGGFGVHSPFVFHFTQFILNEKHSYNAFHKIEELRKTLKTDKREIHIKDLGTGNNRTTTVSRIAKKALKSAKFGQLLFRISNFQNAKDILELGTSLGISTAYLSSPASNSKCITVEGCPEIAAIAKENIKSLGLENIDLRVGNIDTILESIVSKMEKIDLLFIDANHQSEAVIGYFKICLPKLHENSIVIIDDIYWSADMEFAWKTIKEYPEVKSTIDLFQSGLIFFNKNIPIKHYKMRF